MLLYRNSSRYDLYDDLLLYRPRVTADMVFDRVLYLCVNNFMLQKSYVYISKPPV